VDNVEYLPQEVDEEEQVDQQRELMDEIEDEQRQEAGLPPDYPTAEGGKSLFTLFDDVLHLRDNTKVGNLNKMELGDLFISVRDCQKIKEIGKIMNQEGFGDFFGKLGNITLSTSMSKGGWFAELFISHKKFTQKKTVDQEPIQLKKKKWGWLK
jgi:hypothetical protein